MWREILPVTDHARKKPMSRITCAKTSSTRPLVKTRLKQKHKHEPLHSRKYKQCDKQEYPAQAQAQARTLALAQTQPAQQCERMRSEICQICICFLQSKQVPFKFNRELILCRMPGFKTDHKRKGAIWQVKGGEEVGGMGLTQV